MSLSSLAWRSATSWKILTHLSHAENLLKTVTIERTARRKLPRQFGVTDKRGRIVLEGRRAKDVIGMNVRQHHITDRQLGPRANREAQAAAVMQAAAGIDHRHRIATDDETEVGDGVEVARGGVLGNALTNVNAGCDLRHRCRSRRFRAQPRRHAAQAKPAHERRATGQGFVDRGIHRGSVTVPRQAPTVLWS